MRCWLCKRVIIIPDFTPDGIIEAGAIRAGTDKPGNTINRNAAIGVTCGCGAKYSVRVRLESIKDTGKATETEIEEERRRGWR